MGFHYSNMASLFSLFLLLVSVGFFTLMERKILGYFMLRRGPNKPCLLGILVPFADALKLLTKPFIMTSSGSQFLTRLSCFLRFVIPCVLWVFICPYSLSWDWSLSLLSVLVWMSISVYALLAAGWGSNSKYSTLGGTRCIAQCISYEVCLSMLLLSFSLFSSFSLLGLKAHWGSLLLLHLVLILYLVVLAETNRSPFDFAEGESELVSGYNVEYSGPGFVLLFLSEYLSILFISFITGALASDCSFLCSILLCLGFAFSFIWVRGTCPRFRYDQLIALSWKSLLPIVLSSFLLLLVLYYHPHML